MQKKLAGKGLEERKEIIKNKDKGNDDDEAEWWISGKLHQNQINYFTALCDNIKTEKKRIGGHWVIADAHLIKKSVRDLIKYFFLNCIINVF